jgi:pimeloyl-ACP methyl ester carboxylesterase
VSGEQFADVGRGVTLCYETFGASSDRPLLLVMGLGSQMIFWEEDFCDALAARGFYVIRFDNRDTGRSTIMADSPTPTLKQLMLRDKRGTAYPLDDLAADAAGLIEALGIARADIVGASMGGMIAQLIAINHPDRTRSLVSIMSTTGSQLVGRPQPAMYPHLLRRPAKTREGYIAGTVKALEAISSKRYVAGTEHWRGLATRAYDRGYHPAGTARQLAAINTCWNRTKALRKLTIPATVIHGTDDPLVNPSGGRATAKAIKRASLLMLSGMAHDLPRPLWPQMIEGIVATAAAPT